MLLPLRQTYTTLRDRIFYSQYRLSIFIEASHVAKSHISELAVEINDWLYISENTLNPSVPGAIDFMRHVDGISMALTEAVLRGHLSDQFVKELLKTIQMLGTELEVLGISAGNRPVFRCPNALTIIKGGRRHAKT